MKLAIATLLLMTGVMAPALPMNPRGDEHTPDPSEDDRRRATVAWLRDHAVDLRVEGPPSGADVAAVGEMSGAARVVAFGEATHGTHEFLSVRNRIFEFLVEHGSVTTIAVETGFQEALAIDAYLGSAGGEDPGDPVVRAMMSWSNDGQGAGRLENRELLRWLHAYNAAHPARRVHIYGFDLSGRASRGGFPNAPAAVSAAMDYVQRVDPAMARMLRARLGDRLQSFRTRTYSQKDYDRLSSADRDAISAVIADLNAQFLDHAAAWRAATSPVEYALAARLAVAAHQLDTYFRLEYGKTSMVPEAQAYRDGVMAANVEWIADQISPGRLFIFAHDAHVAKGGAHSMGSHLRDTLGPQLFVIGTVDAVRHWGNKIVTAQDADPSALGSVCADTGRAAFVVDLRGIPPAGAVHEWLAEPRTVNPVSFAQTTPYAIRTLQWYDAIVFIRDVNAAN